MSNVLDLEEFRDRHNTLYVTNSLSGVVVQGKPIVVVMNSLVVHDSTGTPRVHATYDFSELPQHYHLWGLRQLNDFHRISSYLDNTTTTTSSVTAAATLKATPPRTWWQRLTKWRKPKLRLVQKLPH